MCVQIFVSDWFKFLNNLPFNIYLSWDVNIKQSSPVQHFLFALWRRFRCLLRSWKTRSRSGLGFLTCVCFGDSGWFREELVIKILHAVELKVMQDVVTRVCLWSHGTTGDLPSGLKRLASSCQRIYLCQQSLCSVNKLLFFSRSLQVRSEINEHTCLLKSAAAS